MWEKIVQLTERKNQTGNLDKSRHRSDSYNIGNPCHTIVSSGV